jgi:hypothetical protein
LDGSVHAIKKNTEALEVGSKQIHLEVNADTTKYTVMSLDHTVRRSHNINTERVEDLKYLETNLKTRNSIQEEIKSSLKSRNACYILRAKSFVFQFGI